MTSLSVNGNLFALSVERGTVAVDFSNELFNERLFVSSTKLEKGNVEVQDGNISLACCAFSPGPKYLAFCFHKELCVHEINSWQLVCKKELKRAASSVLFSPKTDKLVVADKSGDVYLFNFEKIQEEEGHLLLGHVSMILDVLITQDERFILTCDRDEKIRVSRFPDSYIIQSFCLGHKEFVMTMTLLSHNEKLLVSGSGDGTIRIWDFIDGRQSLVHDCSEVIIDGNDNSQSPAVLKIASLKLDENSSLLCATFRNFSGMLVYKILSEHGNILSVAHQVVKLISEPITMCLNKSRDDVWIIEQGFIASLYKIDNKELVAFSTSEVDKVNSVLKKYPNVFCKQFSPSKMIESFYKKNFDNMEDYLKRKMDRLEQNNKKFKTDYKC